MTGKIQSAQKKLPTRHPELPQPRIGSHGLATVKSRISHVATTKFGTVTPNVLVKVTRLSSHEF